MNGLDRSTIFGFRRGMVFFLLISSVWGCAISHTSYLPTATLQPTKAIPIHPTEALHPPTRENLGQGTETPPGDVVWEVLGQVDRHRALTHLRKLTGEEPICKKDGCYTISNRMTGSEGLQWAKDYIYQELTGLGYDVEILDWSRSGYADQNLIARKQGKVNPAEEIYFAAHVDGVQKDKVDRFPAADDNASGVVDLLELARVLSGYSFNRTIVLFFSTGEEQGSLGVKSYLGELSRMELRSIKYVIDIDMIGYDADQDGVMQLFHGNHSPSKVLTEAMKETMLEYHINLTSVITKGCG